MSAGTPQKGTAEAIGHLTGRMAHEFSNILTIVISKADLLAEALPTDAVQVHADLADLRRAARRGADMTDTMLSFVRGQRLDPEPVDLATLVAETIPTLTRLLPDHVQLVTPPADAGRHRVQADPGAVQQILLNLIANARDALPGGGTVSVALERGRAADAVEETVSLIVSDTGAGIAPGIRDRVFEPFFTTKDAGRNVGLGLCLVHGLMRQHGGTVSLEDSTDGGTRLRARFPALPLAATDEPVPDASSPDPDGRILIAEDEDVIRRAAKRVLERYGYTVVQATDGVEALERLAQHGDRMDLVISDIVMPRLDGLELYRNARARGCASPFLFTSGYQAADVWETVDGDPTLDFLPKPWTVPELLARVREILGRQTPAGAREAEAGR